MRILIAAALLFISSQVWGQSCDSLRRQDSLTLEHYLGTITSLSMELRKEKQAFLTYQDHTSDFVMEFGRIRSQRTIYLSTTAAGVIGVVVLLLVRR